MRYRVLTVSITALFIFVAAGLFYMQILRFPYYSSLSKNNSIRIIPIDGPRGTIFDRNGVAVVSNRLSFDVAVIYQELRDRSKLTKVLNSVLDMSGRDVLAALEKAGRKPYIPVTIAEDVGKDKAIMLEEASFDNRGLIIEIRSKRDYLYGYEGSHVFGYLNEITEKELEGLKEYGYRRRDLVGRNGLEKYYDNYLRGSNGGTQIEVDSRGRQTRVIGIKEPSAGKDLHLTMDISLQRTCDKLLGDRKGAVVVMDPASGDILALASHPAFDPNIFIKPNMSAERLKLLNDRVGRPLINRAISGIYSPGSVFKMVISAAALDAKRISRNTTFQCAGFYMLGNARFDCWKEGGHGSQNIITALKNSCNVFFYNTGRLAGSDLIENFSKLFGFGAKTGIDLPDEAKGIVPGRIWKRMNKKGPWYEGDTVNYSIGQGYLLVTPMQVLEMTAIIANNGYMVKPRIVSKIDKQDIPAEKKRTVPIKAETINIIKEGLRDVVNSEGGTGSRAKVDGIVVAGKTGTAQNPQGRTHAWFVGFAPYQNAKLCIVVFLEHGGKGGLEPATIAHGVFEEARQKGYL